MSRSSRLGRPLVVLGAVALLAACGSDDGESSPTSTEAETTTTEDVQAATEADVIAAYEAHWAASIRASDPPDPDAAYLEETHTGLVLEGTRSTLRQYEAEGVGLRGEYETHAEVALLRESSATVEDCGLDRTEIYRLAGDEVVQGSDDEPDGLVVTLLLEDGAWKVSEYERDEGLCER